MKLSRRLLRSTVRAVVIGGFFAGLNSVAQPSGGPYGPQAKTYEIPGGAAHVFYVAPEALADATGATLGQPALLKSAIERAVTGDLIILRGGVYRTGDLILNQGVTFQPYADEQPILKGTEVVAKGEAQVNGLWRIAWPHLFPAKPANWWRRDHEGRKTPLWLFNHDMVFADGRRLTPVGWEGAVTADSYFIDYDGGQIYVALDPATHLLEITAHNSAIVRTTAPANGRDSDRRGYKMFGLTLTQYAYRALEVEGHEPEGPADPATFGKDVIGTTLENVTISQCSRVAGYFRGDHFTMRHCLVSDTITEGVYLIASSDCLLEKNIFRRNNIEEITGYFPSAVKIFNQTHRVTCRDNLVIDQLHSNGIWYDVGNVDGVFVDNWMQNCVDGFFFEISKGAICAGNVFVDCDKGIRVLNSANVRVYQNTLVNTVASFERTERSAVNDHFGWHPATGPDVDKREGHVFVGNLLVGDARFAKPLLRFEQAKVLCGRLTRPMVKELDNNVYVREGDVTSRPLLVWGPAEGDTCSVDLKSPAELHKLHPEFELNSISLSLAPWEVFQSPELRRYAPLRTFAPSVSSGTIPEDVLNLLGWSQNQHPIPGAYQTRL